MILTLKMIYMLMAIVQFLPIHLALHYREMGKEYKRMKTMYSRAYGRINNGYQKQENDVFNIDADYTSQISNHLFEVGGGFNYNIVRNYAVAPVQLAALSDTLTEYEKFEILQPTVFGYDITGKNKTSSGGICTKRTCIRLCIHPG